MVPNYETIEISASANENIVPIIYKKLQARGYTTPIFTLDFIGFQAPEGTKVEINGNIAEVPANGNFYTPYFSSSDHIRIRSVKFQKAFSNMKFWIIY